MVDNLFNLANEYMQRASLLAYFIVYFAGVITSFTSCSYSLLPITVAVVGANSASSRQKGFMLSASYVLGMAVTYTALGALTSSFGVLFGVVQSNPWTNLFVANVCIIMGLSMLGLFSIPFITPRFFVNMKIKNKNKGYKAVFFIGMISALAMSPCATPIILALLGYTASSNNVFFGVSLFFVFSLGMGTLLIIVGTFAGFLVSLPQSGVWLEKINKICGIILIVVGEFFLLQAGILWR
ncbi:MAG: cytochrome c biogenesis protein CcdA [Deltaproteobacteria bacterium]